MEYLNYTINHTIIDNYLYIKIIDNTFVNIYETKHYTDVKIIDQILNNIGEKNIVIVITLQPEQLHINLTYNHLITMDFDIILNKVDVDDYKMLHKKIHNIEKKFIPDLLDKIYQNEIHPPIESIIYIDGRNQMFTSQYYLYSPILIFTNQHLSLYIENEFKNPQSIIPQRKITRIFDGSLLYKKLSEMQYQFEYDNEKKQMKYPFRLVVSKNRFIKVYRKAQHHKEYGYGVYDQSIFDGMDIIIICDTHHKNNIDKYIKSNADFNDIDNKVFIDE